MAFRILFVCTGNTCRSPMAEAIAKHEFREDPRLEIASAGTYADNESCASSGALEVVREHELDLETFQSRRVTEEILDGADCILVMEPSHRSGVLGISPQVDTRTFLLGEVAGCSGREATIPDPFGGPIESYRRTFDRIRTLIRDATGELVAMSERRDDRSEESETR